MDNSIDPRDDRYYVASDEAPPPRRPPLTEVGIIGWLRENLFKTWFDSILTLATMGIVAVILIGLLSWAFFDAQWEIVFLNLRQISVGNLFERDEIWRIDLIVYIIIFMMFLSVSIWGRLNRTFLGVIGLIAAAMIIIPMLTSSVEKPTMHLYIESGYTVREVNFVADEGQELTFTVDPLTDVEDYQIDQIEGYVENNNQQANTSFDAFNERNTAITLQGLDPSPYDLNFFIEVRSAQGEVIYQSDLTNGVVEDQSFTWEAPDTAWYTLTMIFDEEAPGMTGAAWLKVDNVDVFRSTSQGVRELEGKYGTEPELDCEGCNTSLNRTDVRFEGQRTLAQYFSLQVTPYLLETRGMFFNMIIVAAFAFFCGRTALRTNLGTKDGMASFEHTLVLIGSGLLFLYFGVQFALILNPIDVLGDMSFAVFAGILFTAFVYALVQFAKEDYNMVSRGVTMLWFISIPLVWIILTGFSTATGTVDGAVATAEAVPLPSISSESYGGVILTLLTSAVAIVASFPIGILLALGRQSDLPAVSILCTLFIEVIRGVPLITLLFMGRLILPFFGFGLSDVDLLIRIMVVLTLFTSAYLAEVIRGGLQIIPKGQIEAAQALGLTGFWTTILIVLPQALRAVIPAIMGQAVSLFKDTSLLYIVGLFEVVGTMNQILGDSATGYTLFPREGYLYVGIIYFVFSYLMADMSRRIERTGAGSVRRS